MVGITIDGRRDVVGSVRANSVQGYLVGCPEHLLLFFVQAPRPRVTGADSEEGDGPVERTVMAVQ